MTDFSDTELRRLDLTLLLVFLGLLRHRKATRVAAELGLTQSGVSQGVKRLREIFGDPLFLRRPHGMEPTAVALALEPAVGAAVEALRAALGAVRQFDPATARGVVRIAALDSQQAVVIPQFADRVRRSAPGLGLSVLPLGRAAAVDALIEGRVDLALGFVWTLPGVIRSEPLYAEGFTVAGRAAVLPDAPGLTLRQYLAADHILVSPGGDMEGIVDRHLADMGQKRRVVLALPAFLPALAAAEATGALVTLPSRIAHRFAAGFGLVLAEPPLAIRGFTVATHWHLRSDADARVAWLRDQLHHAAQV
jgi:DNA-binding transcriptional LysR family regulator